MPEILIGAIAAGALVGMLRHAAFRRVLGFWAFALAVAAAVYVGFVLIGGAQAGWIIVEMAGLLIFAVLAFVGLKYHPGVLGLA